jgi:cadmium resistance protein CadD (predicted permease)
VTTLTILLLVAGGFAATNIDNLLLLIAWMTIAGRSRAPIFAGYFLAAAAVLTTIYVLGFLSGMLPVEYIGYLGIVPMLLGAKMLWDKLRKRELEVEVESPAKPGAVRVGTTLYANSVDSILVLSAMLADSKLQFDYVIMASYFVAALAFYLLGRIFYSQIAKLEKVTAVAEWVAPLIMLVVGFYILDNTLTDTLVGS